MNINSNRSHSNNNKIYIYLLWIFTAGLFSALVWFATPRGLGLTPDSVAYLKAVQGIHNGLGFSYFSVQWPPAYASMIFAMSTLFENDPTVGVRILNAILYAFTFLLTIVLINIITNKRNYGFNYIIAVTLCLNASITYIYFYALSEALFIPIVLLNIYIIFCYIERKNGLTLLWSVCLCVVGLFAVLSRYSGITLVALNIVAILIIGYKESRARKLTHVALQLMPAFLFLRVWQARLGVGDTDTNQRPFVWHPISLNELFDGVTTLGGWVFQNPLGLAPQFGRVPSLVLGTSIVIFIISGLLMNGLRARQSTDDTFSCKVWILQIFSAGYCLFLILARSLIDPHIMLDVRFLSPILLVALLLPIAQISRIARPQAYAAWFIAIVILYMPSHNHIRHWLQINYFNGVELNDKARLNSQIMRFIRTCSKEASVYADKPWHFNLEFQSMVHWIPTYHLWGTGLPDPNYQIKLRGFPDKADLVIVEDGTSDAARLLSEMESFQLVYSAVDGQVWARLGLKKCVINYE